MSTPILATKLYIPPHRHQAVLRSRLLERLNEGLASGRKLTLISASAGFGKTTLLSEWVAALASCASFTSKERGARAACWLSLDESDSDPTRFLTYFIAALQTIFTALGEGVLAMLQSPQPLPIETLLTNLLNEITARPDPFILVLDDYHLIEAKPIDQALVFLLDHLPPQMHLVIATREDPSLPLARLRTRGQLTELRATDLRFTPAETAEFLNRVMGLNLSSKDVNALETRTEGWIAGLQLAALAMQGLAEQGPISMQEHPDAASFIQSFTGSHHFVLDYLLEEVLQRQPENTQTFLLRTAILNRLCGPLCESVLRDTTISGQATLEALERANLFIIPLDNERRWYRYHHLFGDLLRQRCEQSLPPAEIAEYHLRASQWHEENGELADAFQHALAAEDFERAARLAELAWQGMDESFQTTVWLGWAKKLPETVIRARPMLCVQLGWAFSDAGEPETSEIHLQNAEHALAGATDSAEFRPLPGSIALARAYNAQVQGNLADTVKYAELASRIIPDDDFYRHAQATITLEFMHWASGNLDAARQAMDNWMNSMQKTGNFVFVVASAFAVADLQVAQGHLHEAKKNYLQAIQLAAAHGKEAEQVTAHHHLGLALLAHEWGDEEAAAQHLQKAAEWGKQTTLVDWPYRWQIAQAQLKECAGELDAALELLDEAKRVYVKNPVPILRPVEALKARVYLKQGRVDKARLWAHQQGLAVDGAVSYLREFEYITLARVLIAEGTFSGVNELLERLLKAADGQKRMGDALEILLTQALAHQAQGNSSLALASLERALTLAEPEGYLRIFVNEGQSMQALIAAYAQSYGLERSLIEKQSNHPLARYVHKLLAAFAPTANQQQSAIGRPQPEMIEPLSERELEVLRLIAQGLSNREISQRLFVALSTVKGHNLRIFGKLQVQNRTEAVVRARELGLF